MPNSAIQALVNRHCATGENPYWNSSDGCVYWTDIPASKIFRLDPDGTLTLLWRGTGVANGMGFSPDERVFYWTCSSTKRIFRFDYDAPGGNLCNRRLFYAAAPEEGTPDGLTVDVAGHVWSARNKGFAIIRHAPDGSIVEKIPFPVAKVTSLCFGGPKLDTLFVTTGGAAPDGDTADGTLYSLRVPATGRLEHLSRVLLAPDAV